MKTINGNTQPAVAVRQPIRSSHSKKLAAPPPPTPIRNSLPQSNGSVSTDESDSVSGESLEGRLDLNVVLPDGRVVRIPVERRTPMGDLLVQLTKPYNLSPSSHVLNVDNERGRGVHCYKPNTAIGNLNTDIVYIVPKSSVRDPSVKRESSTRTNSQPFETTFRLKAYLPRNQLHVLRVSPNIPLGEVFVTICGDKDLSASKYELRHPHRPEEKLDYKRCLADYNISEVAVVAIRTPAPPPCVSTNDIIAMEEEKKKKRFGFFRRHKSSQHIDEVGSEGSRGASPTRSDVSSKRSTSPHGPLSTNSVESSNKSSSIIGGGNNNKVKRPAPPPPQKKPEDPVAPPRSAAPTQNGTANKKAKEVAETNGNHSRQSSDSSGYHESSILSDSHEIITTTATTTKTVISSSKEDSTTSNLNKINSVSSVSISSGSGAGGAKKRKAPPPPQKSGTPPVPIPIPALRTSEIVNNNNNLKETESKVSSLNDNNNSSVVVTATANSTATTTTTTIITKTTTTVSESESECVPPAADEKESVVAVAHPEDNEAADSREFTLGDDEDKSENAHINSFRDAAVEVEASVDKLEDDSGCPHEDSAKNSRRSSASSGFSATIIKPPNENEEKIETIETANAETVVHEESQSQEPREQKVISGKIHEAFASIDFEEEESDESSSKNSSVPPPEVALTETAECDISWEYKLPEAPTALISANSTTTSQDHKKSLEVNKNESDDKDSGHQEEPHLQLELSGSSFAELSNVGDNNSPPLSDNEHQSTEIEVVKSVHDESSENDEFDVDEPNQNIDAKSEEEEKSSTASSEVVEAVVIKEDSSEEIVVEQPEEIIMKTESKKTIINEAINKPLIEPKPVTHQQQHITDAVNPVVAAVRLRRRPLDNFSISTYHTRAEVETSYVNRMSKINSWQSQPDSNSSEPKLEISNGTFVFRSKSKSSPTTEEDLDNELLENETSAKLKVSALDSANNDDDDDVILKTDNESIMITTTEKEESMVSMTSKEIAKSTTTVPELDNNKNEVSTAEAQRQLQEQFLQYQQQFLQWQQQLIQNQTMLQKQQILTEPTVVSLQKMQEQIDVLHKQIIPNSSTTETSESLPQPPTQIKTQPQPQPQSQSQPQQELKKEFTENMDTSLYTRSLPRPKPAAKLVAKDSSNQSATLDRRSRPTSVVFGFWNQKALEESSNSKSSVSPPPPSNSSSKSVTTSVSLTKQPSKKIEIIPTPMQKSEQPSPQSVPEVVSVKEIQKKLSSESNNTTTFPKTVKVGVNRQVPSSEQKTITESVVNGGVKENSSITIVNRNSSSAQSSDNKNNNAQGGVPAVGVTAGNAAPPPKSGVTLVSIVAQKPATPASVISGSNSSFPNVVLRQTGKLNNVSSSRVSAPPTVNGKVIVEPKGTIIQSTSAPIKITESSYDNNNNTNNIKVAAHKRQQVPNQTTILPPPHQQQTITHSTAFKQPGQPAPKFTTLVNLMAAQAVPPKTVVVAALSSTIQQQQQQPVPPPPPPPVGHVLVNANNMNVNAATTKVPAAPPQPEPVLAFKKAATLNSAPNRKSVQPSQVDTRDQLLLAIRDFGGRSGLKKVASDSATWQLRHGTL